MEATIQTAFFSEVGAGRSRRRWAKASRTWSSRSENSTAGGKCGSSRPRSVMSMMRQAMTACMATARPSRSALLVAQLFDLAAALEHAVPVLDAPAQAVPLHTAQGLLGGRELDRRQQEPLERLDPCGRILLGPVKDAERHGGLVAVIERRRQLDLLIAKREVGRTCLACGTSLASASLRARALAANQELQLPARFTGADRVEQLLLSCGARSRGRTNGAARSGIPSQASGCCGPASRSSGRARCGCGVRTASGACGR